MNFALEAEEERMVLQVRLGGRPQSFPLPSWLSREVLEDVVSDARLTRILAPLEANQNSIEVAAATAGAVYELAMVVAQERRERLHVRAVERTLRAVHEFGVEAAVHGVVTDGTPELRDGALDVYARVCTGERLVAVKAVLKEISDEFGVWVCFCSEYLADSATEAAFADPHFAWDADGQQVVVR